MIVTVTREHVKRAIRGNGRFCPLALACVDAGIPNPQVFKKSIRANGQTFHLDKPIQDIIAEYDEYGVMAPFSVNLEG